MWKIKNAFGKRDRKRKKRNNKLKKNGQKEQRREGLAEKGTCMGQGKANNKKNKRI